MEALEEQLIRWEGIGLQQVGPFGGSGSPPRPASFQLVLAAAVIFAP